MNSSFRAHGQGHLYGDDAPHPIGPRWRAPAALLLPALSSPQRRQPCRPQPSQRLAFVALSRCARAHLEPQRSPCRRTPSQPTRARPNAVSRIKDQAAGVRHGAQQQGCQPGNAQALEQWVQFEQSNPSDGQVQQHLRTGFASPPELLADARRGQSTNRREQGRPRNIAHGHQREWHAGSHDQQVDRTMVHRRPE